MRIAITLDGRRRTVALPDTLAELLAIRLTGARDTAAVRTWCQQRIDEDPGAYRYGAAGRRLQHLAVLSLASDDVLRVYWDGRTAEKGRT